MADNIKIFIGSEPKTLIAQKVLEFSLLEQLKGNRKIEFCDLSSDDNWTQKTEKGLHAVLGTGFSLLRWDVPRRCNYEGYAIYLDADILALCDVGKLWQADVDYPNEDASIWCTYQPSKWFTDPTPETSVMFIDCKKAKYDLPTMAEIIDYFSRHDDSKREQYIKYMRGLQNNYPPQQIPTNWNHLNVREADTKLLHYTKEPEQPWYNPKHPHAKIWIKWFKKALGAGYIEKKIIVKALKAYRPHSRSVRGEGLHPHYKSLLQ